MRVPVVFLVLAACVVGAAETGAWARTRLGGNFTRSAIVETADGYILSSRSWSETTGQDIAIFKVRLDGSVSWARTFDIEGSQSVVSIDAAQAGGFVVLVWTFSAERESRILRMDDRGNVLWQRGYADETLFGFKRIRSTRDGGFVVGGRIVASEPGRTRLSVAKLNSAGSLTWRADFPLGGEVIELLELREGGYAIVTTAKSPENDLDIQVLRLREGGSIERLTTYGSRGREMAFGAIQTMDGDLVVVGSIIPAPRRDARVIPSAWVMRVRPIQGVVEARGAGRTGNDQWIILSPLRNSNKILGRTQVLLGTTPIFGGRADVYDDGVGPGRGETLSPLAVAYDATLNRIVLLENRGLLQIMDAG